jgi:hypothetical protein
MRTTTYPLFGLAFLSFCAVSQANITDASWANDGDGAINCLQYGSLNNDTLSMYGDQFWAPGHMLGSITTDTIGDPTLYLGSAVDNDTTFAWTGYVVNVVMANPFTFVGAATVSNPSADWSVAGVTAPALQVSGIYAGKYEGTIDFTDGTPLAIGDELDFQYAIHFSGSTDYSFTQEMIPVPEPGMFNLAAMSSCLFGGVQLVKRLRRKV